jgi:hypothetical protein
MRQGLEVGVRVTSDMMCTDCKVARGLLRERRGNTFGLMVVACMALTFGNRM